MTKCALVTGVTSGIGKVIVSHLLRDGWEVYGIGRDFSKCEIEHSLFHPLVCDLCVDAEVRRVLDEISCCDVSLLINNAGSAYYGMHEEICAEKIHEMVKIDLEVPMVLCSRLLRILRKNHGTIVNIDSVTALGPSTHAAVYGACKAGLLHFSRTLFAENRKFGMNVAVILPDMTASDLYRHADFEADETAGCCLDAEDTAAAVDYVLQARHGVCVNEIVLRPQFHRIKKKVRDL